MALEVCSQGLYSRAVLVYIVRMGCGYFSVGGRLSGCSPTIYTFFFSGLCVCEHIHTEKPETTGSESCLCTFQAEVAGAPTESVLKLCIYGIRQ